MIFYYELAYIIAYLNTIYIQGSFLTEAVTLSKYMLLLLIPHKLLLEISGKIQDCS